MAVEYVTVSSKGQLILPKSIRKSLSIKNGDKLAAHYADGIIMLKPVMTDTEDEFSEWMTEAENWAKSVGYVESDIDDIIKSVRKKKRNENSY